LVKDCLSYWQIDIEAELSIATSLKLVFVSFSGSFHLKHAVSPKLSAVPGGCGGRRKCLKSAESVCQGEREGCDFLPRDGSKGAF
jgi:hypothetical protein